MALTAGAAAVAVGFFSYTGLARATQNVRLIRPPGGRPEDDLLILVPNNPVKLNRTAVRILDAGGKVVGVELAKTGKGMEVDAHGRRRPSVLLGSEFTIDVDTVIGTVGQYSDLSFLSAPSDELAGDPKTLASQVPGVFVVGGRKTGASYIVEAIALGHRVARSIHGYLQGQAPDQPVPPAIRAAASSGRRTLRATRRSCFRSRASQTVAIPPRPSSRSSV